MDVLWPHRDMWSWAVIVFAVAAGGMLRGMTGFGAALLMAPLLTSVASARETLCLVTLLNTLPLTHALSPAVRRLVDHRVLLPMLGAACLALPLGLWLVHVLPAAVFAQVIGWAVILSALALMTGVRLVRRRSLPASLVAGAFSGVLTGFGGVGGPPAILYLLGVEQDSHRMRASFLVYFGCLYPVALMAIVAGGLFDRGLVLQGLALAPLFLASGRVGERIYGRLNPRHFRRVVLGLLVATGAFAAWPAKSAALVQSTGAVQQSGAPVLPGSPRPVNKTSI